MKEERAYMSRKKIIAKAALYSRLTVIAIQYISNILIPDHEPEVFHYPKSDNASSIVDNLLGGFLRWDAQYFMHLARFGYTYENTLAFFPLYPLLVRFIALILGLLTPSVSLDSLLLVVFVVVNTVFFVLAALCLYELSFLVINEPLAYKAAILFCYNPASVFFTAPYTECIFSYLTFKSMLNSIILYKKYCAVSRGHLQVKDIVYIIPISLSTITRSNGVLNLGFLVYAFICLYIKKLKTSRNLFDKFTKSIVFLNLIFVSTFLCILPFVLFQIYSYQMYCKDFETVLPAAVLKHSQINNFVLPGTFSKHHQSWCFKAVPLAYEYIQTHYWDVGFLKYFELKQLPNFILACPLVLIVITGAVNFFEQLFPKKVDDIFCLNLIWDKHVPGRFNKYNRVMFVFVVHATFLTVFCVLNIHVQVTTRMLCSASPVLYWFSANYISSKHIDSHLFNKLICLNNKIKETLVIWYFIIYFIVGTVMFCNYLPWT